MLQNAYFLAKIRADTAENEQHFTEICHFADQLPSGRSTPSTSAPRAPRTRRARSSRSTPWARSKISVGRLANLAFFLQNVAHFWRARSRLYQNEILQENMRLTTFVKLYKICILLHLWNPIEKPWKALRASVLRTKHTVLLHRSAFKNSAKSRQTFSHF